MTFPCARKLGNIGCGHKMFLNKIRNIFVSRRQNLCAQQMLRARANGETFVSATMCPQQCVLVSSTLTKSPAAFDVCLDKKFGTSHDLVFKKLHFQNVFSQHENEKQAFSNSSLKREIEKLPFHDGLVCKIGLTVEIKLRFQTCPA